MNKQAPDIPYKYGVIIMTSSEEWFKNLGNLGEGIYVALELPPKMDAKILGANWLDAWLDASKPGLRRKLKAIIRQKLGHNPADKKSLRS